MKLYHYTAVPLLHSILSSEGINQGYFQRSTGEIKHGYVWYTTDPLPYGHGLVDGTELLSDSDKAFLSRAAGGHSNQPVRGTLNKRIIRITVDASWLEEQPDFYSLNELLADSGDPSYYANILGVAGWVDHATLSDEEYKSWLLSPKLKNETWRIHKGTLPLDKITAIDFMESKDNYVPYDFEKHGRAELEKVGIYAITKQQLSDLNNHLTGLEYSDGEVIIVCPKLNSEPAVIFRKVNNPEVFTIRDARHLTQQISQYSLGNRKVVMQWIADNKDALMELWDNSFRDLQRYPA